MNLDSPIACFTNVADRLLLNLAREPEFQQQFGNRSVRLTNIMVWPTNDYTPAVHRTLQLAANLYDALTNHSPLTANLSAPAVFRPIFTKTTTNVVITGYAPVTSVADIYYVPMRDLDNPADMAATWNPSDLVYGVPFIVGAKKGFPNFNALALQTAARVTRKLMVYRPNTYSVPNEIRQMYLLSISNVICVAGWNSYAANYPLGVQIIAAADVTTILINENGIIPTTFGSGQVSNRYSFGAALNIAPNSWEGFQLVQPKFSFRIPLTNNFVSLPTCVWESAAPNSPLGFFKPLTNEFNQPGLTPPHWWLNTRTRLRFILVDPGSSRILDYVNLTADAATLNLSQELMHGADCETNPGFDNSVGGAWCTNKPASYPPYADIPTFGILNQIGVSRGAIPINSVWQNYIDFPPTGNVVAQAIQRFAAFMNANPSATNIAMQAPFSPYRTIYQYISWQANDPLVHYLIPDLTDLLKPPRVIEWDSSKESPISRIGMLNDHYRPWGGNPYNEIGNDSIPATAYHLELKDPLVANSDAWGFPATALSDPGWLGRVHRGTPWQTLYLKSAPVEAATWKLWTGYSANNDAALTQPQRDWKIASLLTTMLNTNHPAQLLSPNNPAPNVWLQTLHGMTILPDVATAAILSSNSPQATQVANAIQSTRASQPGGQFRHPGDILQTAELSVAAPWLSDTNWSYLASYDNTNITDAVCEKIPCQLLPRLRLDSLGEIRSTTGQQQVEFTGMDGFPYAVEFTTNLLNWATISTNLPENGIFIVTPPPALNSRPHLYRSKLLP